jgi:pimeloyl-ACP methyl ester carboxylesterase
MATSVRAYRIAVLHGKGNTGDTYRQRLQPLITAPQFKGVEWVFPTAPYTMSGGSDQREWWRLPRGERSFTASTYEGAEESIALVESLNVDALIGHSQGAILMAVVLARKAQGLSAFKLQKAILSGAAWPKPYEALMEKLTAVPAGTLKTALPTLHVLGAQDDVNPTEQAAEICSLLQGELLMHPGGHVLPTTSTSRSTLNFCCERLRLAA